MSSGLPVGVRFTNINWTLAALAAYFSIASPLIASIFRRVPICRPVLLIGFVFYCGLIATYVTLGALINAGMVDEQTAWVVGVAGILLTRVFMSWLFDKVPVETLAFG